ncbi:hypothetical protein [Microbacterium sp. KR10-403]|uniref:hypothetical protein n=1 Tax=Microbacterium sp. KR10-403 TaxID=3158581 RepID=UPI0032E419DA
MLSTVVLDAAKTSDGVVLRSNHRTPLDESTLAHAFGEARELNATRHLTDAVLQAEYGLLSASDHARAFAALMRSERGFSTALMTLCRDTLESLSRSRWLMHGLPFRTMAHRSISLLYGDLRYPEKYGETLISRDGDEVDPSERRRHFECELERLGLSRPLKIVSTTLVEELVSSDIPHQAGPKFYSLLSAAAHGHRSAINAFVLTSSDQKVLGLSASLPTVTELAFVIAATLLSTADAMVKWYGNPQAEQARIHATWTRIAARSDSLPREAFAE